MTIEEIGSIGELIGAIATVATLAYLAVQIRANTQMMKAESRRSELANGAAWTLLIAEHADLADILNRGLRDYGSLDRIEKTRFGYLIGQAVGGTALAFDELRMGIETGQFEARRANLEAILQTPGGAAWWERFKNQYASPFHNWVDSEIIESAQQIS